MDLGLTGKVTFVAGASRGLGRAVAESMAREGSHVAITARGESDLEATAAAIRDSHARDGAKVLPIAVDLTDAAAADAALARTREELGEIDILVPNVGGSRGTKSWEARDEEWDEVLELNFRVAVRLCRAVIPSMKARGAGSILTISSIFGRESGGAVSYNAAKAALIAMTKSLSRELIPHGIRVNSLAPGSILFPGGGWDKKQKADPEKIAKFVETDLPRGSFGRPEEIGDVAAFLCSARASLVVGACLNVDGGQSRALF